MMATTSTTARNKPDNQNLTRSRPLGPKPNPVPTSNAHGSDRKTVEKPLPNYLKPTASSRPDPVKFLRKNKAVEDNQKLLHRRSFDRPLSSSSSTRTSLNTSPPREKPVTGLRSTSFHGSNRGGLRGRSTRVKSPPLASRGPPGVKKSGGQSGTIACKSKKEGSENVPKKASLPAPSHEDEVEIVKVEIDVQVCDHREEKRERESTQENNREDKELVVDKKVNDEKENSETDVKEVVIEEDVKEEESESSIEERRKKEVVKGSPIAYNDVIASKMKESSRKNKVLALAGAFQTVIDYETAASN